MRLNALRPVFVDTVPDKLEHGVLYVSEKYQTAIHLCACGECGWKTVTPFHYLTGWTYSRSPVKLTQDTTAGGEVDKVTLRPSIGNHQFPCKSHYFITDNKIEWC